MDWSDPLSTGAEYQHVERHGISVTVPEFEVGRRRQILDQKWKMVSLLVASILRLLRGMSTRRFDGRPNGLCAKLKLFMQATMNNQVA